MADSEEYLIKVTGFSPDTKEPSFRLFFSNPIYSGVKYGNIIKLIVEENVAYILFEHAEDAEVLKNHSPYTWVRGAKIYCTYANRDGASMSSKPKPSWSRKYLRKLEHLSLPSTWTPMSKDDSCITVKVDPNSPEYAEAVKLFNTQTGSALKIVQLDRIQNPSSYQKVMTHEKYMKCANQKSRKLFHGTSLDTITKINTNGFNRSYCGKNATAVGKGVYFATGASYSASDIYSRPDASGNKYMYICTVLTGDYTGGNASLIDAPPKDASNPHILYDSVVNDVKNPGMFIVFSDTQAYPDYLITFKC